MKSETKTFAPVICPTEGREQHLLSLSVDCLSLVLHFDESEIRLAASAYPHR
nr:hypothetical protein [Vannielia litorea]